MSYPHHTDIVIIIITTYGSFSGRFHRLIKNNNSNVSECGGDVISLLQCRLISTFVTYDSDGSPLTAHAPMKTLVLSGGPTSAANRLTARPLAAAMTIDNNRCVRDSSPGHLAPRHRTRAHSGVISLFTGARAQSSFERGP